MAIRAQWSPKTDSSELSSGVQHPGATLPHYSDFTLLGSQSYSRRAAIVASDIVTQIPAVSLGVCELLCWSSWCLFHGKEKESLCLMFKWVVPWCFFCCSTHPKINKTASLPHIGGISSFDVIRRPISDYVFSSRSLFKHSLSSLSSPPDGCHDYFLKLFYSNAVLDELLRS